VRYIVGDLARHDCGTKVCCDRRRGPRRTTAPESWRPLVGWNEFLDRDAPL